jgi:hypothetical protein
MRLFPLFFTKQLLLFRLDMSRKDFKCFRIFEDLIIFIIDTLLYSPSERDSRVFSPPRSYDLNWFTKNLLVQNTPCGQDSLMTKTLGSLEFLVYLSPESFFVNLFLCLFQIYHEIDAPLYWSLGSCFGQQLVVYRF